MPINTFTHTLDHNAVVSIPSTGVPRLIVMESSRSYDYGLYKFGFGVTEPTNWSTHYYERNDGMNLSDNMGVLWIWNTSGEVLNLNVHYGV